MADVTLSRIYIASAWNVQGARAAAAAQHLFGIAMPDTPNTVTESATTAALWLGPGSWLVVSGSAPLGDYAAARDALNAAGGALFDVSASRVAFHVGGRRAADVLAAHCPLDFHANTFAPGTCAQSVFGRITALYYRRDGFAVLAARSFGRDVWHGLCEAAAEFGYEENAVTAWPGV